MVLFLVSILGLIIGLIKPSIVLRWLPEGKKNRKQALLYFGGATIAFFILVGVTAPSTTEEVVNEQEVEDEAEKNESTSEEEEKETEEEKTIVGLKGLLVQGIATSIDALSVGFTISDYNWMEALLACLLIGTITFFICYAGLGIGKKAGTKLAGKAGILGGVILILIGLEIFITGIL